MMIISIHPKHAACIEILEVLFDEKAHTYMYWYFYMSEVVTVAPTVITFTQLYQFGCLW